ncbi:MAG: hypothetical protein ACK419_04105, partial [Pyrinomonadaceae bacterium]
MKSKQGKNWGFLATFVCLSLIFAGASPSVLRETLQAKNVFSNDLFDFDLNDLSGFKVEDEQNTSFASFSFKIAEELSKNFSKQTDFVATRRLLRVFESYGAFVVAFSSVSLEAKPKQTLLAFGFDRENRVDSKTDSFRFSGIPYLFLGRIFEELDLSIQSTLKTQVYEISK